MEYTGIKQHVIDEIRALAQEHGIQKIILFGSRAKGGNVAGFSLDVEEETSTLLEYDIVDLNRNIQPELLESIKTEGIIFYEKI